MGHPAPVPFQAQVNGSTKFIVNSNGGVSVGSSTAPPSNGLYVAGGAGVSGNINVDQNHLNNGTISPGPGLNFGPSNSGEGIASKRTSGGNQFGLDFYTQYIPRMSITNSGNVGIGTTNPQYKLSVNGTIQAKEVRVETGWADYVFDKNYKLRSLKEVQDYIIDKKHLPDVPSAKEIQQNGLAVADMQTKMMQKIEELTLYIISQNQQIEQLQQKVAQLEKNVAKRD
jgi:hypothetical protein